MFCIHCGTKNPDDAKHCFSCGREMVVPVADSGGATSPTAVPSQQPGAVASRTSGLAIASLVLGILGLRSAGILALPGLIFGIIGLVQIQRSQGRLRGKGLAIAGIAVSCCVMVIMPASLLLIFGQARQKARQATCESNLKELNLALLMYATDHDERFPAEGVNWDEVLKPYFSSEELLECPSDTERPSYQLNPPVRGLGWSQIRYLAQTVSIFESDDGGNVVYRHMDGANFAFTDGHVKWYQSGDESEQELIWDPLGGGGR